MNTKTMRLPPRRVVTSSNNKRKERDGSDPLKPVAPNAPNAPNPYPNIHHPTPTTLPPLLPKPTSAQAGSTKPIKPNTPTNHILAGYFAHEFLTKGTLFGKPWEPARAEPSSEPKRAKPSQKPEPSGKSEDMNYRRYLEVSRLIRADGAHVPGIVNPTQLARFLQM